LLRSVVIDKFSTDLDVSVFGAVAVLSPVVYVDVEVVIGEYSSLPEVSVVGSDCVVWLVFCSVVVGSSQSIRKTCE